VTRRHPDLAATVMVAAFAALVVTLVPGLPALRTPFAALLLLALPGYSLTAALFGGRAIDWPRRLLLTIGLSISLSVVVGLLLNQTPLGLRASSWSVALLAVTCVACAVAVRLRREVPSLPAVRRRRVPLPDLMFLLGAALLLFSAVALARTPLTAKNVQGYTALWLLPGGGGETATVRVGIRSGELHTVSFRLVIRVGAKVAYERRLPAFQPGRQFEAIVRLGGAAGGRRPTVASLYRQNSPGSVYRVARLWPPKAQTR
jgi:uncharacterized membrane protein